jgi:hypothetical protein
MFFLKRATLSSRFERPGFGDEFVGRYFDGALPGHLSFHVRFKMYPKSSLSKFPQPAFRSIIALVSALMLMPGEIALNAQTPPPPAQAKAPAEQAAPKIPPEQLDALVAPIALYPDPILSQALVASTYPLEIIQLQQWLDKNKNLKDKALADAAMKQPWDPSVQAMAVLPDVVKRLAGDIQWTTDLGNAFLAQQADVMDAVQRMRKKAMDKGALKTTEQQKVETQVVESKTVIVVQPTSTQVVYVPSYNPVVVYGPPVYPYPPVYYPPPPPPGAYVATAAIAFGVGMAVGAAWGGHYGWGCGWGHNDIDINVNNNFNRNTNINRNTNVNPNRAGGAGNTWQHNPQHRGGAPYANQATANKYGGAANRQAGVQPTSRAGSTGVSNRAAGAGGSANRGGAGVSASDRSVGGGSSFDRGGGRGADSIGSRDIPQSSGANRSALGGGSGGYSGGNARASSSRGSSSLGSSRSGDRGGSRGGGGRR